MRNELNREKFKLSAYLRLKVINRQHYTSNTAGDEVCDDTPFKNVKIMKTASSAGSLNLISLSLSLTV